MLDKSVLGRLTADVGEQALSTLLMVFADEVLQLKSMLESTSDRQEIARLAHRLKGMAASYGAETLKRDAMALETEIRQGNEAVTLKTQLAGSAARTAEAIKCQPALWVTG